MNIKPNEPLTCKYMGIPATYVGRCGNNLMLDGFTIRVKLSDIPLIGHKLSYLHKEKPDKWYLPKEGEFDFTVDSLDSDDITDVEEMEI
jgi:hypothetical protein